MTGNKMGKRENSAALYMRLSREDAEIGNSASIENQRKVLRNYALDNGFSAYDEYIDDGFTGTNFDRPAFDRMKQDITSGKIGVVITKDFSRLGRNTGQVMTMLDDFFVRNGVRYISVTEGIDTKTDGFTGMLAPMLSFTNELYSGDISRKINASFSAKMRGGEYIGAFAPYGYRKDPENKNHLLPDPESAKVVERIFLFAKNGYSPGEIANMLNDDKVPTPSMYRMKTNAFAGQKTDKVLCSWNGRTVGRILRNQVYLGHMIQGKTHKPSFKSTYVEHVPKENWIFVPDTHKALVDVETWDIVRKKMQNRAEKGKTGFCNLFSGVAKCAHCGRNMSTVGSRKKGARYNLSCGGYKQLGKSKCTSHTIDYDVLCDIVLEAIREKVHISKEEREQILADIFEKTMKTGNKTDDIKHKHFALSQRIAMAYDKRFSGEIDDVSFEILKDKYEQEKKDLEHMISIEEQREKTEAERQKIMRKQAGTQIMQFENLKELDRDLLFRLIQRIDVHQGVYEKGVKHQEIDIFLKFRTEPVCFQITK